MRYWHPKKPYADSFEFENIDGNDMHILKFYPPQGLMEEPVEIHVPKKFADLIKQSALLSGYEKL